MKHLDDKLYNRFFENFGKRDEYQKSKLNEILAKRDIMTNHLITIFMIISMIWDEFQPAHKNLGTMFLVILMYFNIFYFNKKSKRYRVLENEFTDKEKYNAAIKNVKHRSIWGGIYFSLTLLVLMFYILPLFPHESLETEEPEAFWTDLFEVVFCLLFGLIFGIYVYKTKKNRIKFIKDDE